MDNYIYLNWVLFFSTKQSLNIFSMLQLVSNQIQEKLHPYFITGFSDAEGCFHISIYNNSRSTIGVTCQAIFTIRLSLVDLPLLESIQCFFGVGNIFINKKDNYATYSVKSLKDIINVIIPHFDKYPLLTQKHSDFLLFKSIIQLMEKKEHTTMEGLRKIVSIKASMN
jgi:intein-encoded DNA endonuclease-like protein